MTKGGVKMRAWSKAGGGLIIKGVVKGGDLYNFKGGVKGGALIIKAWSGAWSHNKIYPPPFSVLLFPSSLSLSLLF